MKTINTAFAVLLLTFSSLVSYADQQDLLTVIDEAGKPIAGASILLGYEVGNPFGGNVLTTAANGTASVPTDWKAALPVTVQAPGFIASTVPVAVPGSHRIQLTRQEGQASYEIKGTTTDYGRLITDGKVDFSLVIPALSREQLLAFDLSSVISPENDTITIIGNSQNIPSNIALPQQTENYIFPIELNKPDYRTFVRSAGEYKVVATRGTFPLKRVVDEIRGGKSIFEVINHFTFVGSGERMVTVRGNTAGANLPVNQMTFNSTINVKAPAFAPAHEMLAMALIEKDGLMMPSDLKRFTANQSMALKSNSTVGSAMVLSLLVDKPKEKIDPNQGPVTPEEFLVQAVQPFVINAMDDGADEIAALAAEYDLSKLSFAVQAGNTAANPQFLPMVAKPQINNQNVVKLQVPALGAGLSPAGTYLVFSEIETLGDGKMKNERRTRLWEVYASGWLPQIELPTLKFNRKTDRKYRWEVLFLARPSNVIPQTDAVNKVDLNVISHISRNALDL